MSDSTTAIVIKTIFLVLFLFPLLLDSSGVDGPSACFLGFCWEDGGVPETGGAGAGFDGVGGDTEGGGAEETEELNRFPSFLCQIWWCQNEI